MRRNIHPKKRHMNSQTEQRCRDYELKHGFKIDAHARKRCEPVDRQTAADRSLQGRKQH